MSDEVETNEMIDTPGYRLHKAREATGLTQKAIADDMHLPRNYIMWIEEGAYEKLPSMVFCRGYIRAYAKIVKEDGEALVRLLDQMYGAPNHKAALSSVSKIEEQVKVGDPVMKWPTILIVLILIAGVVWWWKTQYGLPGAEVSFKEEPVSIETANGNELVLPTLNDSVDVLEPVDQPLQELSVAVEDAPKNLPELAVTDESTALVLPPVTAASEAPELNVIAEPISLAVGSEVELPINILPETNSVDETSTMELEEVVKLLGEDEVNTTADAPAIEPVSSEVSVQKELKIQFVNECWVTIKDGLGKIVFNGIKTSGQELVVTGEEPLRVSIGRVNAVSSISYGKSAIDLGSIGRNNIANFKLPL